MATKKTYIGSIGPFLFDDAEDINDSDFPGEQVEGLKSNSTLSPFYTPSGASGSFTTADAKTVTVVNGLITGIV